MDRALLDTLKEAAAAIGVALDERALDLFDRFWRELTYWNTKINLVSFRTPEDLLVKHMIDSLTPVPYIAHPEGRLLDLGTGGGFPGIPLQIALPALHVLLLEASRKKSSFLRHVIRRLPLPRADVMHARVESAIMNDACCRSFHTVISRAAFRLPDLLAMGRFFLSPGGLLIAMRGPGGDGETSPDRDVNLRFIAGHDIRLPVGSHRRKILIYQIDS